MSDKTRAAVTARQAAKAEAAAAAKPVKRRKGSKADGDVTTQNAISTTEAAATDVVLSPVGDEKVDLTK
jgi:hypothetical protein